METSEVEVRKDTEWISLPAELLLYFVSLGLSSRGFCGRVLPVYLLDQPVNKLSEF